MFRTRQLHTDLSHNPMITVALSPVKPRQPTVNTKKGVNLRLEVTNSWVKYVQQGESYDTTINNHITAGCKYFATLFRWACMSCDSSVVLLTNHDWQTHTFVTCWLYPAGPQVYCSAREL